MPATPSPLTVRPYHLMLTVCALGGDPGAAENPTVSRIMKTVRRQPDIPMTLRCNVGDVFTYQDPGPDDDTPEGPEHNLKRDLEILHRLNLAPGCTLPARIVFNRLWDQVKSADGICAYPTTTAEAWRGWGHTEREAYQHGLDAGIDVLIPPRDPKEMVDEKARSLAAMDSEPAIAIRPHILLCSICQYGNGVRPPFDEDNLPELLQKLLAKPETRLRMAPQAEWMMCAPCPYRNPAMNACVNNKGSGGLPNQLRDLRVMQILGLRYGDEISGRDLYARIFERIPGNLPVCRLEQPRPSVWWTGCGAATDNHPGYLKGCRELREAFGIE